MRYLKHLILFVGVIGLFSGQAAVVHSSEIPEFVWQSPTGATYPQYRKYFHNEPGQLPADYIYRTGRVYDRPQSFRSKKINILSWFKDLDGEKQKYLAAQQIKGQNLRTRVHGLSAQLISHAQEDFTDDYVISISSFVNLNDLYRTSSLGRYLSEQMITDLQQAGAGVVEVRKSPAIMIKRGRGEYGMSRDMGELSFVHDAQAMVVGTYTFVESQIFVNARLLRNSDNMVLSSASMVFGLDEISGGMLADEQGVPQAVLAPSAPVRVEAFVE